MKANKEQQQQQTKKNELQLLTKPTLQITNPLKTNGAKRTTI